MTPMRARRGQRSPGAVVRGARMCWGISPVQSPSSGYPGRRRSCPSASHLPPHRRHRQLVVVLEPRSWRDSRTTQHHSTALAPHACPGIQHLPDKIADHHEGEGSPRGLASDQVGDSDHRAAHDGGPSEEPQEREDPSHPGCSCSPKFVIVCHVRESFQVDARAEGCLANRAVLRFAVGGRPSRSPRTSLEHFSDRRASRRTPPDLQRCVNPPGARPGV